MEIDQRINLASRAMEVLENEAYQQAIVQLKTEVMEQWKKSPARDCEGREKLWQLLKLAEKLEEILQTTMETGKLAQLDLLHKQSLMEKAKAYAGMD